MGGMAISDPRTDGPTDDPVSNRPPAPGAALPSPAARALAFLAILAAGVCGGLIGYAVTDLQVDGDGGVAAAVGGIVGAVAAAAGVAVVAVLALRAMTEWRTTEARRARQTPTSRA